MLFELAMNNIFAALRALQYAAVSDAKALLETRPDPNQVYEPDRWSTESPFVSPLWPGE